MHAMSDSADEPRPAVPHGDTELRVWLDDDLVDRRAPIDVVNFLAEEQEVRGRLLWPRDGITLHTANPYGRDVMARAIRADAGRRLRVAESRAPGARPRFRFALPGDDRE